ncbi:MAG: hypothetical protein M1840_002687 [Geoglossum simile]|nr:MAG: hypothetical protein M1840_002687 [Geoglossum simile]
MASSNSIDEPLRSALRDFQDVLSPDQKKMFLAQATTVPDAAAVFILTAEIDRENAKRRSRGVATRLFSILESVQKFSTIVDTFVSSNPSIAALVWGSMKFAILAASNFSSYFDKLSTMFMNMRNHWVAQAAMALWRPFEVEFGNLQNELRRQNERVRIEIDLASQQAAHQERVAASRERRLSRWRAKLDRDEALNWRIQANERQSSGFQERRRSLLNTLSSYDYKTAFKQARRKRYSTTCSWLVQTDEFKGWLGDIQSSLFWCYGIPGSGKTVLTTSIIDELFCRNPTNRPLVRFFFCQYDSPESLKAKTILGSLIRQCLDVDTMSDPIEANLKQLLGDSPPDFEDLNRLMEKVSSVPQEQFIVIDAIDECEQAERSLFLSALRRLMNLPRVELKIFLASGLHIEIELERASRPKYRMSMASSDAHSDINTYIENSIAEKKKNGELVVGQPQLIIEIQDALVRGAQGMFLWATFQIQDICAQGCDEDIRKVIGDLPKDLLETYERALLRINRAGTAKSAQKIFRWVAAAKRPLSLEELREAIAIQPCQPSLNSEALENNINRLVPYCGNLILLDEEDQVVQFAHHTVKRFLLAESRTPSLDGFHFQLPHANHDAGEVCVTYLNFNDFKQQLAKISATQTRIYDPSAMLRVSLSAGLNISTTNPWLRWVQPETAPNTGKIDVGRQLYDAAGVNGPGSFEKLRAAYALLPYASEHWLSHSSTFAEGNTKTWRLWNNLLLTKSSFAQMPWTFDEWAHRTQSVIRWVLQNDHCALLRHIESSDTNALSSEGRRQILVSSAAQGLSQIVDMLINLGKIKNTDLGVALAAAAERGHLDVVERLLAAKADVNAAAGAYGRTALQVAAEWGHLDVVEKLLLVKADVNAAGGDRMALQAAAEGGHLDVVERLLLVKADVNAGGDRTALQAAAEGGHLDVVERLLVANADVNAVAAAQYYGRTALQAAAEGGHLDVVERLLLVKADVNAAGGDRTALQAAAEGGHLDMVERLVANTDINAVGAAVVYGRTALQAAAGRGHLDVVERLLVANADVNAAAAEYYGRTALQAAAEGGHLDVVERLLLVKADVNAAGDRTALQAAAEGGHLDVVERLLVAKADVNAATAGTYGRTALQLAIRGGHLDVVKRLKQAGGK